eukprot:CAMPEP_0117660180 /NCGR_PEP_ID=MMETSP0804-20121206/6829_1 /TAXON_ID=1074897 /ORGANISM="Tetraselmis astigmatica, Strain CCMP880" /LENGTH=553 /DNA_ID=CAMNT_0005466889 /DNA_START=229 /DNA_END=1886 /DNA_ORIENTATION=-
MIAAPRAPLPAAVSPSMDRAPRDRACCLISRTPMSPQGRQAHGAVLTRQGMPLRSWGTQLNDTTCRRAHGVGCPAVAEGEGAGASAPIATEGDDTIVAIVSGEIQGAVSILRLSGSQAVEIASEVFQTPGKPGSWEPRSHRVYYGTARDREGNMLDEVLALVMLSPRSYTCEDVVEIHSHGGVVCARRVLNACLEAGARLARPGEFTLRAFLNGRLDLTQAESVEQLVSAKTASAADSAIAGLQGGIGGVVSQHRAECIAILAELEARLDFADEEIPPLAQKELEERLQVLQENVEATATTARVGQLMRNGLQVALVGRPNVGKSSLLNACSGTERAIVTNIPGTTRDVVEAAVSIGGVPVTLLDTAGLREASDAVERIGVERSRATALAADIVIMVVDASLGWTEDDQILCDSLWGECVVDGVRQPRVTAPSLLVLNKTDLLDPRSTQDLVADVPDSVKHFFSSIILTSASESDGVENLNKELLTLAGAPELAQGSAGWAVNMRQAEALTRAREALVNVQGSIQGQLPIDFWTIDLRGAAYALGEVTGDEVA